MLIVKVKKFGVDWYIPYEMAADSASARVTCNSLPGEKRSGNFRGNLGPNISERN